MEEPKTDQDGLQEFASTLIGGTTITPALVLPMHGYSYEDDPIMFWASSRDRAPLNIAL